MKRLLSIIVLGVVLAAVVVPMGAMAIEQISETCTMTHTIVVDSSPDCATKGQPCDVGAGTCPGICCLLNSVYTVTDWMFYLLTILVVFMVIYGGFAYITAAGDPEKAGKGKKILTYAIIGLAIALLAKIIPSVVKFIVGVS